MKREHSETDDDGASRKKSRTAANASGFLHVPTSSVPRVVAHIDAGTGFRLPRPLQQIVSWYTGFVPFSDSVDPNWRSNLTTGTRVDAQDRNSKWYPSTIIAIHEGCAQVQFDHWDSFYNEDIDLTSDSLAPLRSRCKKYGYHPGWGIFSCTSQRVVRIWNGSAHMQVYQSTRYVNSPWMGLTLPLGTQLSDVVDVALDVGDNICIVHSDGTLQLRTSNGSWLVQETLSLPREPRLLAGRFGVVYVCDDETTLLEQHKDQALYYDHLLSMQSGFPSPSWNDQQVIASPTA